MGQRYVVIAEYVTAGTKDALTGKPLLVGYYRNALLPEDVSDKTIQHLLSVKQIQPLPDDVEAADLEDKRQTEAGTGTPDGAGDGDPASTPVVGEAQVVKVGDDVPEPKASDKRELWVDYAVSKGADREEIEGKNVTKADLIATHATPRK